MKPLPPFRIRRIGALWFLDAWDERRGAYSPIHSAPSFADLVDAYRHVVASRPATFHSAILATIMMEKLK